ncbi:MAG TPA: methyl-accepting chemotaxis protein, partial [Noviherbaspirillum sp.]
MVTNKITIKSRLIFVIAFLSVLLIAGGVIGLVSLHFANAALKTNYENRLVPMGQLDRAVRLIEQTRLAVAESMHAEPAFVHREMANVERFLKEIDTTWAAYLDGLPSKDERERGQALVAVYEKFNREGLQPAIAALHAEDNATATVLMRGHMRELSASVRDGIDALMRMQLDSAKTEFERSQVTYRIVFIGCGAGILLGVLLAVLIGIWLVRSISVPLDAAVRVARGVAAGDLAQTIDVVSEDEAGQLMRALREMNQSLEKIVRRVRSG